MKRLHYYLLFVLIAGTVIFVLSILLIVKEEVVYTRFCLYTLIARFN